MFCTVINDAGTTVDAPTVKDLARCIDRLQNESGYTMSLGRDIDMDAGIEVCNTLEGVAILGAEDSLRGSFGFYFYDPSRGRQRRTVSIFDILDANICDSMNATRLILNTYLLHGDLDRRFNWSLNVEKAGDMLYDCRLEAGDERPIADVLASVSQDCTWA